ncbi:MAG: AEC family transporter [Anaerolineales bacterium]|nr:AEC family transporter [Anaerolineales bacterium]
MKPLPAILYNNIVPIFIAIGLGYTLERRLRIEIKSISRTVFYALSPCLVFSSLVNSSVSGGDFWDIVSFEILITLGMALVAWGVARALRFDRAMESAFLLATLFMNAGNYGLSINQLAFGDEALARAIIYFAVSSLLMNTTGVYLASRGKAKASNALLNVFKVPIVYAVLLAILVKLINLDVTGSPIFRAVEMVGQGAVPLMLLLLGMQLAKTSLAQGIRTAGLAAFIRLAVAPVIAFSLASLLGLTGPTLQACVVEASMPTAVTTAVLAIEFDARPEFVTSVIFLSTLASPITLTLIIALVS